ncbi:2'-5' RNA ligase family protein [Pseudarthrobacter sp. H2]|uniref:2'-5' RNA ligase family protein n=1 Tax=Pseudarthrobacter sp. H2 TaxID=3418415 RepID=UPI003CEBED69
MTAATAGAVEVPEMVEEFADPYRYGVFLRPSAELGSAALAAYDVVTRQFGFTAAAAYPPHMTLVGNFAVDPAHGEDGLVAVLNGVLEGAPALAIHNSGLGLQFGTSIGYQVDGDGHGGINTGLHALVGRLFDGISRVRVFPASDRRMAQRRLEGGHTFQGHVTVLGHDGSRNPELVREVLDYLAPLGLDGPASYRGDTVTLYRFNSDNWSGDYWETMDWEVIRSWALS